MQNLVQARNFLSACVSAIGSVQAEQAWLELEIHLTVRSCMYRVGYGQEEADNRAWEDLCMALRGCGPASTNWAVLYLWACVKTTEQDGLARVCQQVVDAEQSSRLASGRPCRYRAELYAHPAAIGYRGFASKFPSLPEPDLEWDRLVAGWVRAGADVNVLLKTAFGSASLASSAPEADSEPAQLRVKAVPAAPLQDLPADPDVPPDRPAPQGGGGRRKAERAHLKVLPGGKA